MALVRRSVSCHAVDASAGRHTHRVHTAAHSRSGCLESLSLPCSPSPPRDMQTAQLRRPGHGLSPPLGSAHKVQPASCHIRRRWPATPSVPGRAIRRHCATLHRASITGAPSLPAHHTPRSMAASARTHCAVSSHRRSSQDSSPGIVARLARSVADQAAHYSSSRQGRRWRRGTLAS